MAVVAGSFKSNPKQVHRCSYFFKTFIAFIWLIPVYLSPQTDLNFLNNGFYTDNEFILKFFDKHLTFNAHYTLLS